VIRFPALLAAALLACAAARAQEGMESPAALSDAPGAVVHYQLPADGLLPQTYLVTLAVTDPRDPAWIVANFACGIVRTVTAQNQGRFAETWDGLDENGMPVPPGRYGVKGIFMPAQKWAIDGQYHSIVPKLAATGGSWGQSPAEDPLPGVVEGDPVDSPLGDVDVAPGGIGAVAFQYLENGHNFFRTDFNRPIGYGQILAGYESGEFAGATSTCTDGTATWSYSDDGGVKYIGRADGKPFGHQRAGRDNVCVPDGFITALAAWPDKDAGRTVVFTAERGRMIGGDHESTDDFVNRVRALDGRDASVLAEWKIDRPLALAARHGRLYILHGRGDRFEVLTVPLGPGWPDAHPTQLFTVPPGIHPFDLEADSHGRVYLSDPDANHVFQFDAQGKLLRTYGRLAAQPPGHYDAQTFMAPEKLACWTDAQGRDRLLVVEMAGPNRLSEWSGDTGELLRQWVTPQTRANDGYGIDPQQPDLLYLQGQRDTLVRWKIDYATSQWTPDAVWTGIGPSGFDNKLVQALNRPTVIHRGADTYIAFGRGSVLYHLEGDRLRACAAVLVDHTDADHSAYYLWSDRNGDGRVQPGEYRPFPAHAPPGTFRYFGESWFDDLSLVCIGQDTPDIWRLAPASFDARGTPLYRSGDWCKLLTDEIFTARQAGKATVLRGGNEVGTAFNSDWAFPAQGPNGEVYVSARSGPDFSANLGAQYKLSRYVPDDNGVLHQRWRVGRVALTGAARPGEVYGPMFVEPPLNGIVTVIDNSRAGMVLYTEDGLYIDTLFPDDHLVGHDQMGAYWQPGEFFAGGVYANKDDGKIYLAMGKTMPQLFEAKGWTSTTTPVRPIPSLDRTVTLRANEIGMPTAAQLEVRGGAAAAKVALFKPATGGAPALDGSMTGWTTCNPIQFSNGPDQSVEVRCLYDRSHLYLRWHARTGHDVEMRPLGLPEHLFAHDRGADTLGLYLQGDPQASSSASGGRPGDVRFVFALARDQGAVRPVVLGMYPSWNGPGATPRSYRTPAGGTVSFANVALVPHVQGGYVLDPDGEGFTLAVALPRAALPDAPALEGWRTVGNFDANFGGHDRFWWSDTDGSASRETQDEPTEARFYPGAWSPIQCAPVDPLPIRSWRAIGPFGLPEIDRLNYDNDREKIIRLLMSATFPPDAHRDFNATYDGPQTQTRAKQRDLSWKNVELGGNIVDLQKTLGWDGGNDEGTAYLVTRIYSPNAADVTLDLTHPDGQYALSGRLNGHPLPTVTTPDGDGFTRLDSKPLHLQPGWNELLIRRDTIWGDLTIGATLSADPKVLWQLKIAAP
jgi:hypothetical protein